MPSTSQLTATPSAAPPAAHNDSRGPAGVAAGAPMTGGGGGLEGVAVTMMTWTADAVLPAGSAAVQLRVTCGPAGAVCVGGRGEVSARSYVCA